MPKKYCVGILTLGCKVNQYESEALAERFAARGIEVREPSCACDGYVVNTCTVTAEADRKSRQMIRRLHQFNPAAPIVVTGCTAQTSPEKLAAIEGVAAVVGNSAKLTCADILIDAMENRVSGDTRIIVPDLALVPFEPMCLRSFPRTRVYIKIEDGCENKCAYCAIPGARGPVRSKAPEDVISEIRGFIDAGVREIVLTGIETASYGKDLKNVTLADLLRQADAVCGDCRIRLGSVDPSLFRQSFVDGIKDLRSVAPHFHISLQSGSSKTLAGMRRKYNADGARAAMERIRTAIPGVQFTTDVIVGFPGETDEDFAETKQFLIDERFLTVHIFPYSRRRGTPADTMRDQVPEEVKHARAAELASLEAEIRRDILDGIVSAGGTYPVLFETFADGIATGHTPSFLEVAVPSERDLHGITRNVRITSHDGNVLRGIIDEN